MHLSTEILLPISWNCHLHGVFVVQSSVSPSRTSGGNSSPLTNKCVAERSGDRQLQSGCGSARTGRPIFTGAFGPRRNMSRINQASELRKMIAPPLVRLPDCGAIASRPRFQLAPPSAPVAIKRVHAVGHVDAPIYKCGSGQLIFLIQLECRGHNPPEK
jgi:hypothetical protein